MRKAEKYKFEKNKKTDFKSRVSAFFTSSLKLSLAAAVLFVVALIVMAGDNIVQPGQIDLDSKFVVDANGNVGIGTASPDDNLHIEASDSGKIHITRAGADNVLLGDGSGTNDGALFLYDGAGALKTLIRAGADSYIQGGNVGIGTASPVQRLHVATPTGTVFIDTEAGPTSTAGIRFGDSADTGRGSIQYQNQGGDTGEFMKFMVAGEKMRIQQGGNVGIGTASPTTKLEIGGTPGVDGIKFPDGTLQTTAASGGSGIPSGAVMPFNLASCPTGWSPLANGAGRVVIGTGTLGTDTYNLLDIGGEARHTLTTSEIPAHTHSYTTRSFTFDSPFGGGSISKSSSQGATTGSTGGSQAHENRPAYIALLYCQKD
jgi:hypothetical protein